MAAWSPPPETYAIKNCDGRVLRQSLTVTVKVPHLLGWRFWMAAKIIALAGWVSGTIIRVEVEG